MTADLGRHIKNGKEFLETKTFINTNYYSYTMPDYPTINHHWGTGVIFYLIYNSFGFTGLSVFFIIISTLALLPLIYISIKQSNSYLTIFSFLLSIQLISSRTEIRPELFTFLFVNIVFWILYLFWQNKISFKTLMLIITPIQILWVNLHLLFILGPVIVFIFAVSACLNNCKYIKLFLLSIVLFAVSVINPFGIKGLLEPLNIFTNYGYRIVENQSIFFLQKLVPRFLYSHFEILLIILISLMLYIFYYDRKFIQKNVIFVFMVGFFGVLAFTHMRELPFFGEFFALCFSIFFYRFLEIFNIDKKVLNYFLYFSLVMIVAGFMFIEGYFSPFSNDFGIGLLPNIQKSAEFYNTAHIKGPVFNNYDIGGYLIFNLFPKEKVFVDNRPEAYTNKFFSEEYIPMEENNITWQKQEENYKFNSIFFYRHDYTPWSQNFLINRIKDKSWIPVYVDDYSIIFLKNNEQNRATIVKYEIPKDLFIVSN